MQSARYKIVLVCTWNMYISNQVFGCFDMWVYIVNKQYMNEVVSTAGKHANAQYPVNVAKQLPHMKLVKEALLDVYHNEQFKEIMDQQLFLNDSSILAEEKWVDKVANSLDRNYAEDVRNTIMALQFVDNVCRIFVFNLCTSLFDMDVPGNNDDAGVDDLAIALVENFLGVVKGSPGALRRFVESELLCKLLTCICDALDSYKHIKSWKLLLSNLKSDLSSIAQRQLGDHPRILTGANFAIDKLLLHFKQKEPAGQLFAMEKEDAKHCLNAVISLESVRKHCFDRSISAYVSNYKTDVMNHLEEEIVLHLISAAEDEQLVYMDPRSRSVAYVLFALIVVMNNLKLLEKLRVIGIETAVDDVEENEFEDDSLQKKSLLKRLVSMLQVNDTLTASGNRRKGKFATVPWTSQQLKQRTGVKDYSGRTDSTAFVTDILKLFTGCGMTFKKLVTFVFSKLDPRYVDLQDWDKLVVNKLADTGDDAAFGGLLLRKKPDAAAAVKLKLPDFLTCKGNTGSNVKEEEEDEENITAIAKKATKNENLVKTMQFRCSKLGSCTAFPGSKRTLSDSKYLCFCSEEGIDKDCMDLYEVLSNIMSNKYKGKHRYLEKSEFGSVDIDRAAYMYYINI